MFVGAGQKLWPTLRAAFVRNDAYGSNEIPFYAFDYRLRVMLGAYVLMHPLNYLIMLRCSAAHPNCVVLLCLYLNVDDNNATVRVVWANVYIECHELTTTQSQTILI